MIGFNLIQIETHQFATFEENRTDSSSINVDVNLEFKLSQEEQIIIVLVTINFLQEDKAIIKLKCSCGFIIEPSAWESFRKDGKMVFPVDFGRHIAMQTVGTARGILHEKVSSTVFKHLILPAVNVADMIKTDIEFELN